MSLQTKGSHIRAKLDFGLGFAETPWTTRGWRKGRSTALIQTRHNQNIVSLFVLTLKASRLGLKCLRPSGVVGKMRRTRPGASQAQEHVVLV